MREYKTTDRQWDILAIGIALFFILAAFPIMFVGVEEIVARCLLLMGFVARCLLLMGLAIVSMCLVQLIIRVRNNSWGVRVK